VSERGLGGAKAKYLEEPAASGILRKQKVGRSNYYINKKLYAILTNESMRTGA
jgi:hypothetical protein